MFPYEIVSTLFFFVLGIWVAVSSCAMGFGKWEDPGPGFMGVLSGTVLSLLSLLWLGISWARRHHGSPSNVKFFPEKQSPISIAKTFLPLCCFALFLEYLGFLICSFFFLAFLFKENSRSWWYSLRISFIVSILTFFIFQVWLQIQFSEGLIPIYRIKKWIF
jgi:hypothetical protein